MEENLQFSNEKAREVYESSLKNPDLTKALLRECMDKGNLQAAMVFAENLAELMPDSYEPIHDKCAVLLCMDELGDIGLCLADAASRFGDDPDYINDRLTYTMEVMGTAAAKKYLAKIGDKQAYESQRYLELCAQIYYAEGDEKEYIECLYILHKKYNSERARLLLALKSIERGCYEPALKWFVAVINDYTGSPEYFMALSGRCAVLKLLERDNWREETEKAAKEIDLAASVHALNMWLRSISAGLWEMVGDTTHFGYDNQVIAELQKFVDNPEKFIWEAKARKVNNGNNPSK